MLSIGQFSKVCQVSIKTLHHYDKIGLMNPCHVDGFTGYRYYDAEQIPMMLLIQRLKRYGFSLTDIRDLTTCQDQEALLDKLKQQKELLYNQVKQTSHVIGEMEKHLIEFERTGDIMGYQNNYAVSVKTAEDIVILSTRQVMSMDDFGKYYGVLYEKVGREHLTPAGKVLAIYHDEEFNREANDTEVALEIAEKDKATRVLQGGLCATTIHKGSYSSLSDAYGALVKWIQQSDYKIAGAPYEIYIKTQFQQLPPDEWETEIYFPIQKK